MPQPRVYWWLGIVVLLRAGQVSFGQSKGGTFDRFAAGNLKHRQQSVRPDGYTVEWVEKVKKGAKKDPKATTSDL